MLFLPAGLHQHGHAGLASGQLVCLELDFQIQLCEPAILFVIVVLARMDVTLFNSDETATYN